MLLRLAAGGTALTGGILSLATAGVAPDGPVVGVLLLAGGCLLVVGFITPVAAATIALLQAGDALGWIGIGSNSAQTLQAALLPAVVSTAVLLLGPGAFALDARLFGRREIVIGPDRRPQD